MRRAEGLIMKYAMLYATGSSLVAAVQYSQSGWVRASPPHLPIGVTVSLNFVGAAMVGLLGDRVRPQATTRWRAAGLGAVVSLPVFPLVYLTAMPGSMTLRQIVSAVALCGVVGAMFAAAGWLPDE